MAVIYYAAMISHRGLIRIFLNSSQQRISREFCAQRDGFLSEYNSATQDYFLFPMGIKVNSLRPKSTSKTMSIFETIDDYEVNIAEAGFTLENVLEEVFDFVLNSHTFIHIPSDLDFQEYTKIEGKTIQALMGTTVEDMIKSSFDNSFIQEINSNLDNFIEQISTKLEKYEYRKPGKKQTLFNSSHLTSKIIETYFESKVLNLK